MDTQGSSTPADDASSRTTDGTDSDDPHRYDEPPAYSAGRYDVSQMTWRQPPDPITPFIAPPVSRRPRNDWMVLVVALIIAMLVMAGCCAAGYAIYLSYGNFGNLFH